MLAFALAAALATSPTAAAPAECLRPDPAETMVDQQVLDRGKAPALQAYAVSRRDAESPWGYGASRVVIYGADCAVVYAQRFDDGLETHFASAKLGGRPILEITTLIPGGSGFGLEQVLLGYDEDGVFHLAPQRLRYGNMDGFHLGDLGEGRGEGLMLWEAHWDGAHYDPHRYTVTTWRWRKDHFVGPEVWTTRKHYDPDPETVAKALGLPADQTEIQRFKLYFGK